MRNNFFQSGKPSIYWFTVLTSKQTAWHSTLVPHGPGHSQKHEHGSDVLEAVRVPGRPEYCRGRSHCDPQAAGVPIKKRTTSRKGKGNKAGKGVPERRTIRKLATQSLNEVLYVEAWGENGDKLAQKCQVGDLVSIQEGAVVAATAQYSTSRLHYHLNLKGPLGLQVIVQKLDEDPWQGIPAVHPLVPLSALDRVKDRQ